MEQYSFEGLDETYEAATVEIVLFHPGYRLSRARLTTAEQFVTFLRETA